jgi:hypothetical protein
MPIVGLTHDRFDFPLTQTELVDATGPLQCTSTEPFRAGPVVYRASAKALTITEPARAGCRGF